MTDYNEVARLHGVWRNMMARVYKPHNNSYANYGGRGIVVVKEWHDFGGFCSWAINHGSGLGLQLDRTDNDGPYGPENCTFVTPTINANNKRSNFRFEAFGETKTIAEWLRDPRCGIKGQRTLSRRVQVFGWTGEEALTLRRKEQRRKVYSCGHPYTEDNSYICKGKNNTRRWVCKTCGKAKAKEQYRVKAQRKKAGLYG